MREEFKTLNRHANELQKGVASFQRLKMIGHHILICKECLDITAKEMGILAAAQYWWRLRHSELLGTLVVPEAKDPVKKIEITTDDRKILRSLGIKNDFEDEDTKAEKDPEC